MARLFSTGWELNSTATGMEFDEWGGVGTTITIATDIVRSGTYSLKYTNTGANASGYCKNRIFSSGAGRNWYVSMWVYVTTYPGAGQFLTLFGVDLHGTGSRARLRMTETGTVTLRNASADVGSPSSVLSKDVWHKLELHYDSTPASGSQVLEGRIDGVSFASSTTETSTTMGNIDSVYWGPSFGSAGIAYFDDGIVNDSSGSFENSWSGNDEIIHLRPNGNGDNSDWFFVGDNYTEVDEITPDDTTTKVTSNTVNNIDDYNIDNAPLAMDSGDMIKCVHVGVRFNVSSAQTDGIVLRIKASASGTVEESSSISNTSTTWSTNSVSVPRNYQLTLYDLPGASTTAWTKADIDTSQIGIRLGTSGGVANSQVSTIWLLVDHTTAATNLTTGTFMTTNTNFWGA